jgi:hypothetical protein
MATYTEVTKSGKIDFKIGPSQKITHNGKETKVFFVHRKFHDAYVNVAIVKAKDHKEALQLTVNGLNGERAYNNIDFGFFTNL